MRITRKRKLDDRRKAKGQKEDWLEKKKEAIETTDKQREDAGKFNDYDDVHCKQATYCFTMRHTSLGSPCLLCIVYGFRS